jgi:hypothetical protein
VFTVNGHTDAQHIAEFEARWEWVRPNFIVLSENQGRYFVDGERRIWLPEGKENTDFIILSDHNRSTAPFGIERIGTRKRMINGDMRAYFVADKLSISLDWDDLPSRAYATLEGYETYAAYEASKVAYKEWQQSNMSTPEPTITTPSCKFTADGGAGGVEMLKWHNSHKGSMWAFFSFDGVGVDIGQEATFKGYSRVYEMMITDFEYEVTKRSTGFPVADETYYLDLWNVSLTLEEV